MDKILMTGMRFFGHHGALPGEKEKAQPFVVDVVLEADLGAAGLCDDLGQTVDYGEAFGLVRSVVESQNFDLIEAIASRIADMLLLTYSRVSAVEVTVKKPQAPVDGDFAYFAASLRRVRTKRCYIGLGSNTGNRMGYLREAIRLLGLLPETSITAVSSVYETAPWGKTDQEDFLNQVVELRTALDPWRLLNEVHRIEDTLGRVRREKWGPRVIDLDILWFEGIEINTEKLVLPHRYLAERLFTLYPLAEIDPNLPLPGGRSVQEVLEEKKAGERPGEIRKLVHN